MKKIKLELTLDEVNTILQALGELPFKEVYELIGTINQQASNQLQNGAALDAPSKPSKNE